MSTTHHAHLWFTLASTWERMNIFNDNAIQHIPVSFNIIIITSSISYRRHYRGTNIHITPMILITQGTNHVTMKYLHSLMCISASPTTWDNESAVNGSSGTCESDKNPLCHIRVHFKAQVGFPLSFHSYIAHCEAFNLSMQLQLSELVFNQRFVHGLITVLCNIKVDLLSII